MAPSLLVLTQADDEHALAVQAAFRRWQLPCELLVTSNFPQSMEIDVTRGASLEIRDTALGASYQLGPDTVVWNRRRRAGELPALDDEQNQRLCERECQEFMRGVYLLMAQTGVWVNPLDAQHAMSSKLLQQRLAWEVGLRMPETHVGNAPGVVRGFVARQPTIYKPFYPWAFVGEAGRVARSYCTAIDSDALPTDEWLRYLPGIYQERVAKAYEVRLTYLDGECVAARLDSQAHAGSTVDSRIGGYDVPVSACTLPEAVEARCRELMRRAGLVFGCLDLIVTPEGEHIFLEVNPMGQWLWLEEMCPELRLVERFSALLARRLGVTGPLPPVGWHDVADEVAGAKARLAERCVRPADFLRLG